MAKSLPNTTWVNTCSKNPRKICRLGQHRQKSPIFFFSLRQVRSSPRQCTNLPEKKRKNMLSLSLRLCRRRFFRDFSTCITLRSKRTMDVPKSFPNITTVTNKPTMIVYHGNCPDGFGAAFCAWKVLLEIPFLLLLINL